jgi:polar amino acid transport system substrate-binding protein
MNGDEMRRVRVKANAAIIGLIALTALTLVGLGGSAAVAASCTPKHPGLKTVKEGFLTVALYESPPFGTLSNGKLGGAEGEIVNRIARMECLKVNPLESVAAGNIPAIISGRADTAIGSWYRTAARAKVVLLGLPEMKDQMVIVSKKGKPFKTIQELKGHNVGAIVGYLWVADLQKFLGSNLKLYQTDDGAYRDVAAGRIDATIDGYSAVKGQLKKTPISGAVVATPPADPAVKASTAPGQPNLPVNKNNPGLRKALDADLLALRASGELKRIVVANGFAASAANPGRPNLL